jgi:hypothetical protein
MPLDSPGPSCDARPVAAFDAELYLRLVGEEALLDGPSQGRGPGWSTSMTDAAAALVAVAALPSDVAATITRDYDLARSLRGDQHMVPWLHGFHPPPRALGRPLAPARVAVSGDTADTSWGSVKVEYVMLSEDATVVEVFAIERVAGSISMANAMPLLKDDKGASTQAGFSGGGGPSGYHGQLSGGPLSPTTAWIELDSGRFELRDVATSVEVALEELEPSTAAERHLWQRLTANHHGHMHVDGDGLERTIDALVACGALEPSDRVIREVRAVRTAIESNDVSVPDLPSRWRSVLRRGGAFGPMAFHANGDDARIVPVGATTPPIDGIYVRIDLLRIESVSFSVVVAVSPSHAVGMHDWGRAVDEEGLTFWAEDDQGNAYLGTLQGSQGGAEFSQATIQFAPTIDPAAKWIDVMPTATRHRAVVRIPLGGDDL